MPDAQLQFRTDADGTETAYWEGLTTNVNGEPWKSPMFSDKTYQIFGSFGGTGVLTLQGSNDPRVITDPNNAVWFTLEDPSGTDIAPTAAAGGLIHPNPVYIRPKCTLGTSPDIDVHIIGRK